MGTHIVWDWNGTLLHDTEAVIRATNAAFARIGLPPITLARYRELYCVPIPRFYQRLMGRLPTEEEWAMLDEAFNHHYARLAPGCTLSRGAAELLVGRLAAGGTQSLCSLAPHEELVPLVRRHGIEEHFLLVEGRRGPSHSGKAEQMARHLAGLTGIDPRCTVVIGDALDDARAAAHAGARAVLYTGGSHSRESLERAGVPVVDTLAEAVRVADELAS
ncbi:phosphatase [Wenjunlia vitaminophila]|uniref:Phosphatase n=1 Tax=Wenjunlia vitaminophila TaxID=76728 RepID=A0A0T6LNH9_WENVI|nr:HAD hydrolase-like protein [Wenjunlia vitaminophila]KRV47659.1 phosphatase [Wenjunlia vitaminophila]